MRLLWAIIFSVILTASAASAKVWLLPDYQNKPMFSQRVNNDRQGVLDKDTSTKIKCSNYQNLYAASDIPTGMTCGKSTRIGGVECFGDCACSPSYQYSSSTCRSAGKIPTGTACEGKYRECICDTSIYPHTSSSCAYTLSGSPCSDKFGTHYPQCINPCDGLIDNETDLGCDKYYDQCPTLCELGKTCVSNDCSEYDLTACPANAICTSCAIGCGDNSAMFQAVGCTKGFFKPKTYWCLQKPYC